MRSIKLCSTIAGALSFIICLLPAYAADNAGSKADSARQCLSLARIRNIEVLDQNTILFHMDGNNYYLNRLPHTCHGLSRHKAIMYKTSLTQLCDLDTITVLDTVGSGYMPGASCGLGKFEAMTEAEADAFKQQLKSGRKE